MNKQLLQISEEIYKKELLLLFPEFIKVDGINYKQVSSKTVHNIYNFDYVAYDGNFVNWEYRLCEYTEANYNNIFNYIETFLKNITYEVLSEVITKEKQFHRELSQIINKYNMECLGGDTPDYILATYLISCLENFGMAVNNRNIHKGEEK